MITPDLKQNLLYTIFFTVTHNLPALVYSAGILFAAILSVLKPTRKSVLLLIGFIILLFGYEYEKHILDGLREQTLNALITIQEHNKVRRIVNLVLVKALPVVLPVTGWLLVGASLYGYLRLKINRPSPDRKDKK